MLLLTLTWRYDDGWLQHCHHHHRHYYYHGCCSPSFGEYIFGIFLFLFFLSLSSPAFTYQILSLCDFYYNYFFYKYVRMVRMRAYFNSHARILLREKSMLSSVLTTFELFRASRHLNGQENRHLCEENLRYSRFTCTIFANFPPTIFK